MERLCYKLGTWRLKDTDSQDLIKKNVRLPYRKHGIEWNLTRINPFLMGLHGMVAQNRIKNN